MSTQAVIQEMSRQYLSRGVAYASGSKRVHTIEQAEGGRVFCQRLLIDNSYSDGAVEIG